VAKYMGDGVLIYFGYPQAHEDDAERAVRAGLELVASSRSPTTSQIMGAARRHEPRTPLARPRQSAAGPRTVGPGVRVVH
jgi:class 3 adenylate cyclase